MQRKTSQSSPVGRRQDERLQQRGLQRGGQLQDVGRDVQAQVAQLELHVAGGAAGAHVDHDRRLAGLQHRAVHAAAAALLNSVPHRMHWFPGRPWACIGCTSGGAQWRLGMNACTIQCHRLICSHGSTRARCCNPCMQKALIFAERACAWRQTMGNQATCRWSQKQATHRAAAAAHIDARLDVQQASFLRRRACPYAGSMRCARTGNAPRYCRRPG